jgi:hypothetical protein
MVAVPAAGSVGLGGSGGETVGEGVGVGLGLRCRGAGGRRGRRHGVLPYHRRVHVRDRWQCSRDRQGCWIGPVTGAAQFAAPIAAVTSVVSLLTVSSLDARVDSASGVEPDRIANW